MKKSTLILKPDIMVCWKCTGTGIVEEKTCSLCEGTKVFIENHYIIIDETNKIAIDSDTGG